MARRVEFRAGALGEGSIEVDEQSKTRRAHQKVQQSNQTGNFSYEGIILVWDGRRKNETYGIAEAP